MPEDDGVFSVSALKGLLGKKSQVVEFLTFWQIVVCRLEYKQELNVREDDSII